jgi:hypothetical protein
LSVAARGALVIACIAVLALAYVWLDAPEDVEPAPSASTGDPPGRVEVATDVVEGGPARVEDRPSVPPNPRTSYTRPAYALQLMAKYPERPPQPAFVAADGRFAAEAIDPLWAPRMEAEILDEFAQVGSARLVTLEVECRTTVCRIEVLERAVGGREMRPEERAPVFGQLAARLELGSPKASLFETDGTVTSLGYLARTLATGR